MCGTQDPGPRIVSADQMQPGYPAPALPQHGAALLGCSDPEEVALVAPAWGSLPIWLCRGRAETRPSPAAAPDDHPAHAIAC